MKQSQRTTEILRAEAAGMDISFDEGRMCYLVCRLTEDGKLFEIGGVSEDAVDSLPPKIVRQLIERIKWGNDQCQ